ncbi:protein LDOC1 [Sphaerodactylus townsendi]|uniref:protein LDOC1 n=1 Tax=Sphaerodactylus townsendi TaxID=933632 RepID=UPI002025E6F0|nr:protein LDOC1 [Sphaerodactylus townsendi]
MEARAQQAETKLWEYQQMSSASQSAGYTMMSRPPPMPPPPPAPLAHLQPRPRIPARFDGTASKLPYFILQLDAHMQEYDDLYRSEREKVRDIGSVLDGEAAEWFVELFELEVDKLNSVAELLQGLRLRFEDRDMVEKARKTLKTIKQGGRPFADFAHQFRAAASKIPD